MKIQNSLLVLALLSSCGTVGYPPALPYDAREATFFLSCWQPVGATLVPEACHSPTAVTWDYLPLLVHSDLKNRLTVHRTIKVWNQWMGLEVFKYTERGTWADVQVIYGGEPLMPWLAVTVFWTYDHRPHAGIQVFTRGLGAADTMAHEFGHVLGLAHDPNNNRSIMYPNAARVVPWLTPADVQWIEGNLTKVPTLARLRRRSKLHVSTIWPRFFRQETTPHSVFDCVWSSSYQSLQNDCQSFQPQPPSADPELHK